MSISITELNKAVDSLNEALKLYNDSVDGSSERKAFRDACIQRFEYSLELSWKTSMKVLGSNAQAAKPAVREMARNNLIDNPSDWLEFVDARNNTSHSYDEDVALSVFESLKKFIPCALLLIHKLQKS